MTATHLSHAHFQSPGGQVLKIRIPGLVFVMFKQQNCGFCRSFMPQFEAMSMKEQRVKFCYAEISGENRKIVLMAQTTNTSIKTVPMFIVYVNGSPAFKYNGVHEQGKMLAFLNQIIMKVGGASAPPNFMHQQPARQPARQTAVDNQQTNLGYSREDLEKKSQKMLMPDYAIPHNAPYMSQEYKNLNG